MEDIREEEEEMNVGSATRKRGGSVSLFEEIKQEWNLAKQKLSEKEAKVEEWGKRVEEATNERKEAKAIRLRDFAVSERDKATARVKDLEKQLENLRAKKSKLIHTVLDFKSAFKQVINDIHWPSSVHDFAPRFVELKQDNPFRVSVRQAAVYGSFTKPTKPDFLLTEMQKEIDYTTLCRFNIKEEVYQEISTAITDKVTARCKAIVLVGTSGSGKTLYSYQRACKEYSAMLVCDTKGNGGSLDLSITIDDAIRKKEDGQTVNEIKGYMTSQVKKMVFFRSALLNLCIERYGDSFLPVHWLMAQLYPKSLFGLDVFDKFSKLNVAIEQATLFNDRIQLIVLDEAQIADNELVNFFPSKTKGEGKRSLLSPIVQTISEFTGQMIVCGTGLSTASVYETSISPLKRGVATGIFGVTTFFSMDDIRNVLRKWGVTEKLSQDVYETFIGRPRHAAFLASVIMMEGGYKEITVKEEIEEIVQQYVGMLKKTRGLSVNKPRRRVKTTFAEDLYYRLKKCALNSILGRDFAIAKGDATNALKLGVCALKQEKETEKTNVKTARVIGSNVKRVEFVVGEPLLVQALVKEARAEHEQLYLTGADSYVGDWFEDYLALCASDFGDCIRNAARSLDPVVKSFDKEWKFCGSLLKRFAEQSFCADEEYKYLHEALKQKKSIVIFPCEAMGPDLIVLLWCKKQPLVILVQARSGKSASTPKAFLTLELLYCQNRKQVQLSAQGQGGNSNSQRFLKLLSNFKCLRALVVMKPLEGSLSPYVKQNGSSILEVIVNKDTWKESMPGLEEGIKNLAHFKNVDTPQIIGRRGRWEKLEAEFPNRSILQYEPKVRLYLTGNKPEEYTLEWAVRKIRDAINDG
jgi:hypothetical protein